MSRPVRRGASAACLFVALALLPPGAARASGEPVLVAAAASLRHVLPDLTRAWVETAAPRPR